MEGAGRHVGSNKVYQIRDSSGRADTVQFEESELEKQVPRKLLLEAARSSKRGHPDSSFIQTVRSNMSKRRITKL